MKRIVSHFVASTLYFSHVGGVVVCTVLSTLLGLRALKCVWVQLPKHIIGWFSDPLVPDSVRKGIALLTLWSVGYIGSEHALGYVQTYLAMRTYVRCTLLYT